MNTRDAIELVCRAASSWANGSGNAREILRAVAIVRRLKGKAKR